MSGGRIDADALLAKARAKEGLDDVGPGDFEEALRVLAAAYDAAPLTDAGARILGGGLVHSLRMRLRATEWFRRHPEIADEDVSDPVVVVGMMRSGTTLTQRLLAADPRHRCVRGWEVLEAAPPLDHDPATPAERDPRAEAGRQREEMTRTFAPDLFAIHPMHAGEAEEEIVFLADAFRSHVPESYAEVPEYRHWLDAADLTPAYDHLHRMLQLVQWFQRAARAMEVEEAGHGRHETSRFVLKSPAHLGYLDLLLRRFPGAHVVHLHRDPRATIASGASLNTVLHRMHADPADVDPARIGREWLARMGWTCDRALDVRARWEREGGALPVTDVGFADVVADPLGEMARVHAGLGVEPTAEAEAAMRDWLARRPPEPGRPAYELADFGLAEGEVDERFVRYRERFAGCLGRR